MVSEAILDHSKLTYHSSRAFSVVIYTAAGIFGQMEASPTPPPLDRTLLVVLEQAKTNQFPLPCSIAFFHNALWVGCGLLSFRVFVDVYDLLSLSSANPQANRSPKANKHYI